MDAKAKREEENSIGRWSFGGRREIVFSGDLCFEIFDQREDGVVISYGLLKKEIASKLSISGHTVDNHIRHIYGKLQVQNAPAAIAKAFRSGLFPS